MNTARLMAAIRPDTPAGSGTMTVNRVMCPAHPTTATSASASGRVDENTEISDHDVNYEIVADGEVFAFSVWAVGTEKPDSPRPRYCARAPTQRAVVARVHVRQPAEKSN